MYVSKAKSHLLQRLLHSNVRVGYVSGAAFVRDVLEAGGARGVDDVQELFPASSLQEHP